MSENNGVIRVGRKGLKKFAFGEDGPVFEVDVVVAFQEWITTDASFRQEDGTGPILSTDMAAYHLAAVGFAEKISGNEPNPLTEAMAAERCINRPSKITTAEALDFIARLREQYDELVVFFQPRSRERLASPDISEGASALRFSTEES